MKTVRIGIVATNQERKDLGLMAEVCAKLAEALRAEGRDLLVWLHTDTLKRAWDIDALIADYGLSDVTGTITVEVTLAPMHEEELVRRYRACDVTLAPGCEGFGYPIFESLACGVPVVHGAYAGGASLMATCGLTPLLVRPVAWRLEGQFNARRPVYDANDWVECVLEVLSTRLDWCARVAHLDWPALGPRWQKWFDDGIQVVKV